MTKWTYIAVSILSVAIVCGGIFMWLIRLPTPEDRYFTLPQETETESVMSRLKEEGYVRHVRTFRIISSLRGLEKIRPGGYLIQKGTNAWELVAILSDNPKMEWVTIPEGFRKEEIAERLTEKLEWNLEDIATFLGAPKALGYAIDEGIYFPDTYLINRDANGEQVAKIMINRFNEQFFEYQKKLSEQNIKWDTALKIASLVQREAGNNEDMPIIAAVIWNRLLLGMKLDIDATLQYAIGNSENGYWPRVTRENKEIDSPYNTYRIRGLPPTSISNPGIAAINAVISPADTKCLYYLHDREGAIHCAVT